MGNSENHENIPEGLKPVNHFKWSQILGTWYEIAHFEEDQIDHNLSDMKIDFVEFPTGKVEMKSISYLESAKKWVKMNGKIRYRTEKENGALEVNYVGLKWIPLNVMEIKEEKYMLLFGRNTSYFQMLSRERGMPQKIKDQFSKDLELAGYDMDKVHWTDQTLEIPD